MLPPKPSVYAYHVLSLSLQRFVWPNTILAFFGPDMKAEMDVIIYMYLKYSPDYIDS